MKQRYRNVVKKVCTLPGADADTDHNLLAATIRMRLKRIRKTRRRKKWNLDKLSERKMEFANAVNISMQNVVDHNPDDGLMQWEILKHAVKEAAEKEIGYQMKARAKKPWVSGEMIDKMDQRRRFKHQNTEEAKREYRRLNNELRRETERAREKWWNDKCQEINNLYNENRIDKMYASIKRLNRKPMNTTQSNAIEDKDGNLLTEKEDILRRWKEYIEELYSTKRQTDMKLEEESAIVEEDRGPELLPEELEKTLHSLTNNKAVGIDDIPAEFLKELNGEAKEALFQICQYIYKTGIWPEDFTTSVVVTLQKKHNAKVCSDFTEQ